MVRNNTLFYYLKFNVFWNILLMCFYVAGYYSNNETNVHAFVRINGRKINGSISRIRMIR